MIRKTSLVASIRVRSASTQALRRFAGGALTALFLLSVPACGRDGDNSGGNVTKVESAVVTGTAPVLTVSAGTTAFTAQAGAVVVDPNLNLTISDASDLAGVQVSISSGYVNGQDVLGFTAQAGVVGTFVAATGVLTFTGQVPVTTYQTLLRSVTYNNTAGASPNTQARQVSFSIGATSLAYAGHYYEFVSTGLNWANARTAAAARTYYGLQGYLATVTSAGEDAFVDSKLTATGWIGASDAAVEGTWRWVTGPEALLASGAGLHFWTGLSGGSTPNFAAWAGGEPNNSGNEDYAQFYAGTGGLWNDLNGTQGLGYVVEYGGTAGDPTPQVSGTKNLTVSITPSYTITASVGANGAISPTGANSVVQGQSLAFTITPSTNYTVASVLVDGVSVGAVTTYTFSNVTASHTISATFSPPTIILSSGDNQNAVVGTAFGAALVVLVTDIGGTPLSGRLVAFTAPGAGASATFTGTGITNASGFASITATANATAGAYVATATVSGTSSSLTFNLRNLGAPSSITVVSGSGQSATVNGAFASLTALVRDVTSFALPNITVTFSSPGTGASAGLSPTSAVTNAAGQASTAATANAVAGTYNVSASAPGVATSATFALTNVAGGASMIALVSGGAQMATVGSTFTAPVIVRVTDAFANPVLGSTVTFAAPSTGAASTFAPPTPSSNVAGLAQTTVSANAIAGGYTISATVAVGGGATASVTATLTNVAGAPATMTVTGGSGQIALTGAAFALPLSVRVVDGSGNPITGATVGFAATASPATGASAVLGSATGASNSSGIASVGATANASAGTYTVTASIAGASSVTFTLTNQLLLTLSPTGAAVAPNGSVTFTAIGGSGSGYVFSVQSAPSGGSIGASTGVYRAGATPLVTDTITVTDSQSHTANASISVGAGLALSSTPTHVPPRGSAAFSTVGGSGTGLIFAISTNRSGGTIDASGHYVAGQNDNVTDVVSVADSLGNTAMASIDVGAGVTLTAGATQAPPRGTLSFVASGGNGTGFVFALGTNASGGTIVPGTGAYTAGSTPGVVDVVTVTDLLGNVATANVAVGPGVTVNPASQSIAPRGTTTLAASGGSGTGYTFALGVTTSGGVINAASGVYVAGAAPSSTDVVTVTDSLGNTGTASIAVGGGISVTPSSLATPPRGSQTFTVSGGSGTGFSFVLTGHASGGTINAAPGAATAAYTAGAIGSTADVLTIVDSLSNGTTVAITVGPGLALSPPAATVAPLGHQTMAVSGGSGSGYTFALSPNLSGSTIDPLTGAYVAGGTGNIADVIIAADSFGNTATATITVTAPLLAVTGTLSAAPRASLTVAAAGGAPAYVFSISNNGSGGTINPVTGAYTAGTNPDSTDVITITDQNGASTNAIINVGAGVAIVPAHPSTAPRGSIAFGGTHGSGMDYTFVIADNQSGGTIDSATGAYTAGANGNVADLITVTDSLGNTASVSVAVGDRLVLGPTNATIAPRETLTLVAVSGSGSGYVYAFSDNASGGTLDSSTGVYAAGATPDVVDVLTVTDSLGNTAATSITIGPGITVTPPSVITVPRGIVRLTVAGGSATGYQVALTTNASGGSVRFGDIYFAGPNGGTTDVLTVTDSLGNTATVNITVGPGVTVTAPLALLPPRGTTTFTAVGGVGGGYTFALRTNGSDGNIVATTGVYTAGDHADSVDVVEATDPFGNSATLEIHVSAGITITPAALSAPPRGTLTLIASGGSGSGYQYSFTDNASGGTLDVATGQYVAGDTSDVLDAVLVTDPLGNTASAVIAVGGALTINPGHPALAPRGTVILTAAGGSGMGFVYVLTTNASGASINANTGRYTAGTKGNVQDVVTVTDTLDNTARATMTVGDAVHVSPPIVQAAPLAEMTFIVGGGSGAGYTFALTENSSHGTIDPSTGAYIAGAVGGGTDVVTVTDSFGNTATVRIQLSAALTAMPSTATSAPRGTVPITVIGGAPALTYTLTTNGSGGSINPTTGVYTAGTKGGTTDVITVRDANNATVTITIQIGPGVSIAPVVGPTHTGQRLPLTATGGSGSGHHWVVVSAGSGGTVDPDTGAYTAGDHAGTDIVRVTDSLGNTADISIVAVATSTGSRAVDLRGGGCACAMDSGSSGGATGMGATALSFLVIGLALVASRRRRSAPRDRSTAARAMAILVAGGILSLASSTARAQTAAFALDRFNPSQRGSDWFVLDSLDIRGHLRPAVGLSTSWAYRPLVLTNPDGSYRTSVVTNQAITHAGGSLVMWDRVRFGLDVPVQIFGQGNSTTVDGVTYDGPANSSSLGDIRLNATVRAFGGRGAAITGAFALNAFLPTGDGSSYAGNNGAGLAPSGLVAGEVGRFAYAAQLGATVRRRTDFAGTSIGSDLFLSAAAGIRLADAKVLIGPEIFGRSVLAGGAFLDARATPVEAMLGAHYRILPEWRASAGMATGLNGGIGSPILRGLIAVEWAPGLPAPDRDNDSIADAADACPDTAGIAASDARTHGCPPAPRRRAPPSDRDRDGIADAADACPDTAGIAASDARAHGCPPAPPDRDMDTIADAVDACPDVAGAASADAKANGCPPVPARPADRDLDGIADDADACPDHPGIVASDRAANGCPDPDRDHDGIANTEDACPDAAGAPSTDAKRSGCPKAFVADGQIKILDQLKFRSASTALVRNGRVDKDNEESLIAVRQILVEHTEVKSLRVEGHTDNVGGGDHNRKLSAGRAAAVVKWLVAHGIATDRLTSEGFGPDRPTDVNTTRAGRSNNRRVEFHIVPVDGRVSSQ